MVAQGDIEENKAETFGGYGWCRVKNLQRLYRDVLLRHFPHHVAITQTHVGNVLWEALGNYLGMRRLPRHAGDAGACIRRGCRFEGGLGFRDQLTQSRDRRSRPDPSQAAG